MLRLETEKFIDENLIQQKVKELGQAISRDYQGRQLVVVGILQGSFIFLADLIRHIDADVRLEFLGISSYGQSMKSSGEVKLTLDLTNSIEGKDVLLVEDIVDSGLTMDFLSKSLALRKPKSLKSCALIVKPHKSQMTKSTPTGTTAPINFKPDYVGFEADCAFLVGYGLDYQGYYRNLPYLAVVTEKETLLC